MPMHLTHSVAYFSMEVALNDAMPTYSGGLGVLAGDMLRAAADIGLDMIGVTLLHRKGYLRQHLDASGLQTESPDEWNIRDFLCELPQRVDVKYEGRTVQLRAWKAEVTGVSGAKVPVYFLDTDLPENSDWDRSLTDCLYGDGHRYRLGQEIVLGTGGVRMLRALGHQDIGRYHMNEGHAALLGLELLKESAASAGRTRISMEDVEAVRQACVFTTHTPVPAGHDQFPLQETLDAVGPVDADMDWKSVVCHEGLVNLTYMALNLSHYVNGVAKRHGEVSRHLFPQSRIDAITNGVHAATWISPSFQRLFDQHIADWRKDNFALRYALSIPEDEVWKAHLEAKRALLAQVRQQTKLAMDEGILTIGFARRATAYKRSDLLFQNPDRLRGIAAKTPLQFIFAGKAHPNDIAGKKLIQHIFQMKESLQDSLRIVYLEDYDLRLARLMTAGVDVWLNTPQPPLEASGTSGMKAALNGVPSLSILDGWWLEGHIDNVTGWSIGEDRAESDSLPDRERDAASLYDKLQNAIAPVFYLNRSHFIEIMIRCIGLNGSFFNTQRMLQQYVLNAYFR